GRATARSRQADRASTRLMRDIRTMRLNALRTKRPKLQFMRQLPRRRSHKAGQLKEATDLLDQTIAELRARPAEKLGLPGCMVYRADLALAVGDVNASLALAKDADALAACAPKSKQRLVIWIRLESSRCSRWRSCCLRSGKIILAREPPGRSREADLDP